MASDHEQENESYLLVATPRNDWRILDPTAIMVALVEAADMLGIDLIILRQRRVPDE